MSNLGGPVQSNPLATTKHPVPAFFVGGQAPRRLRWAESEEAIAYRPARSRLILAVIGALWNLGFLLALAPKVPPQQHALVLAAIACFALLALRECLLIVRVRFDAGHMIVTGGALSPWTRRVLPIADIERIALLTRVDDSPRLQASFHAGPPVTLPISFDGAPIKGSWSRRPPFLAPDEVYIFAAKRLNEKLEEAKHRTGPTYR